MWLEDDEFRELTNWEWVYFDHDHRIFASFQCAFTLKKVEHVVVDWAQKNKQSMKVIEGCEEGNKGLEKNENGIFSEKGKLRSKEMEMKKIRLLEQR
jgi:hypothetical protein